MKLFTAEISIDYFACVCYKYTTALTKNQIKNAVAVSHCGVPPLPFRRSGGRQLAEVALPAVINVKRGKIKVLINLLQKIADF